VETLANEVFACYCELYYGKTSTSSVYLWDVEDSSSSSLPFAGVFLVRKSIDHEHSFVKEGYWNSIHIVEVGGVTAGRALYKLTTTILLHMTPNAASFGFGDVDTVLGGSLSRQTEKICPVLPTAGSDYGQVHVANLGAMIEDMEIDMRSSIDSLYIQKTREILDTTRRPDTRANVTQGHAHTNMLTQAVLARKHGK